jgi:hypothetical protein
MNRTCIIEFVWVSGVYRKIFYIFISIFTDWFIVMTETSLSVTFNFVY